MVLGIGDGAGGGEGGDVGGGVELEQRHGWLQKDNEVISTAWKCLLLWQISMLGGAFEQEGAGKRKRIISEAVRYLLFWADSNQANMKGESRRA